MSGRTGQPVVPCPQSIVSQSAAGADLSRRITTLSFSVKASLLAACPVLASRAASLAPGSSEARFAAFQLPAEACRGFSSDLYR